MDINLWISILLAIPLSILANLLTPRFQAWLDRRSKARSLKRTKVLQAELKEIKKFLEDRQGFREFLLWVIIKTTFIGSIVALLAGLVFVFPQLLDLHSLDFEILEFETDLARILYTLGQLITLIGSLMVINIAGGGLRTYNRVTDFDEYRATIDNYLGKDQK